MRIFQIFETETPAHIRQEYLSSKEFKTDLVLQNIRKGKFFAIIVIILEAIVSSIDIISYLLHVNDAFQYFSYFTMYFLMISINAMYLCLNHSYRKIGISIGAMHTFTIIFITFVMTWGSVISLMDQKLYSHTTVFMENMIVCSSIFYLDSKCMSIPFTSSTVLFMVALPFFQSSSNILIGHYTNVAICVALSWVISRIMYRSYCESYISHKLLHRANALLENKIKENSTINMKLSIANAQLSELALVDDLTKLPNRRGFHAFIDNRTSDVFYKQTLSIIMIDIDYFKLYNDYFGHQYGDKVLSAVAECLKTILTSPDSIAVRWGGEEFIYASFNTDQESTISTANTIRQMVLDLKIPNHGLTDNPYLSISLGTCTSDIVGVNEIGNVIKRADEALYRAKRSGRNCVVTYSPDGVIVSAAVNVS